MAHGRRNRCPPSVAIGERNQIHGRAQLTPLGRPACAHVPITGQLGFSSQGPGALNHKPIFLQLWRLEVRDQGASRFGFSQCHSPWLVDATFSLCLPVDFPVWVCVLLSSYKDTSQVGSDHLCKGHTSKCKHVSGVLGIRTSNVSIAGSCNSAFNSRQWTMIQPWEGVSTEHARMSMNLEVIMLSEGSGTQTAAGVVIPLIRNVQNGQIPRDRK